MPTHNFENTLRVSRVYISPAIEGQSTSPKLRSKSEISPSTVRYQARRNLSIWSDNHLSAAYQRYITSPRCTRVHARWSTFHRQIHRGGEGPTVRSIASLINRNRCRPWSSLSTRYVYNSAAATLSTSVVNVRAGKIHVQSFKDGGNVDVKLNAARRYSIYIEDDRMRLLRMQITCPRSSVFFFLFFLFFFFFFARLNYSRTSWSITPRRSRWKVLEMLRNEGNELQRIGTQNLRIDSLRETVIVVWTTIVFACFRIERCTAAPAKTTTILIWRTWRDNFPAKINCKCYETRRRFVSFLVCLEAQRRGRREESETGRK